MGTNYYLQKDFIPGVKATLHIGKCSCGWVFCFHLYPHKIENLEQMLNILQHGDIVDEYDRQYTIDEFITLINTKEKHDRHCRGYIHRDGFDWLEGEWS